MMYHRTTRTAELLGVHPNTLKMWEKQGVIPEAERDSTGCRLYSESDIAKLKEIAAQRREMYQKQQSGK